MTVGHARADLQARGAVFAIDEDLRFHDMSFIFIKLQPFPESLRKRLESIYQHLDSVC